MCGHYTSSFLSSISLSNIYINEIGTLTSMSGAVSELQGLSSAFLGGICYYRYKSGTGYFTVVSISTTASGVTTLGAFHISPSPTILLGIRAIPSSILSINIGYHVLGGILDPLGNIVTQSYYDTPSLRWIVEFQQLV